jgi:hypothetical protein
MTHTEHWSDGCVCWISPSFTGYCPKHSNTEENPAMIEHNPFLCDNCVAGRPCRIKALNEIEDAQHQEEVTAFVNQPRRVGGWLARMSDPEGLPVYDTTQGNAAYRGTR